MSAAELPARPGRPWELPPFLLALLIGVGAYLGALTLFRWPAEVAPPSREPAPFVHYAQAGNTAQAAVMREQEMFSDPQLLYMLTPHNFAQRAANAPAPRPQPVLQPFALQPSADDVGLNMSSLSSRAAQVAAPTEALKPEQWDPLHTMGQMPNSRSPLPPRGARLRIDRQQAGAGTANSTLEITWPTSMAPNAGSAFWQPVNFMLHFNASGLVGDPQQDGSLSITHADDNPKVDEDLRKKLGGYFRLHPLPPGYYTVEIGP